MPPALLELANALAGLPGALEERAKEAQLPCPRNLLGIGFWLSPRMAVTKTVSIQRCC